jgi:hypothetical protein
VGARCQRARWCGNDITAPLAPRELRWITARGLKLDSQVAQLVQAMATYAADNPSFNPVTATEAPKSSALQSAIAAAWHS